MFLIGRECMQTNGSEEKYGLWVGHTCIYSDVCVPRPIYNHSSRGHYFKSLSDDKNG